MSKPRAIGTQYENDVLEMLRMIWPTADRAALKGINDAGDFINVPLIVEAKKRNTTKAWRIAEWIRVVKHKAQIAGKQWILVFAADRRSFPGDYVVMDRSFAAILLYCWYLRANPDA